MTWPLGFPGPVSQVKRNWGRGSSPSSRACQYGRSPCSTLEWEKKLQHKVE